MHSSLQVGLSRSTRWKHQVSGRVANSNTAKGRGWPLERGRTFELLSTQPVVGILDRFSWLILL